MSPGPTEIAESVGSGSQTMGVEIMNVEAEFHEMEEAVLSDKDVDFHVRDILKSVSLVSLISMNAIL